MMMQVINNYILKLVTEVNTKKVLKFKHRRGWSKSKVLFYSCKN